MKGLSVNVMGRDCTNSGVTSGVSRAVLVTREGGVSSPAPNCPALVLIEGGITGYLNVSRDTGEVSRVKAVPIIDGKPTAGMFGGHFIHTSNARFPFESPIPVFDRFED